MSAAHTAPSQDPRAFLRQVIEHCEHLLPAQAAIRDFVHHNTLHGFQHLPFPQALAAAHRLTGTYGYLPQEEFHAAHRAGRIRREDLVQVLDADPELAAGEVVFRAHGETVCRRDILLAALLHPLKPVTSCQLNWQLEELNALAAFQPDVEADSRARLLAAAGKHGQRSEAAAIDDLWKACLQALGLEHYIVHPEELLDMSPEQAEQLLSSVLSGEEHGSPGRKLMDHLIDREAGTLLADLEARLGQDLTLAGLLRVLTGEDLMETLRPQLIRYLGAFLDQGLAAWNVPLREQGFYVAWRASARRDHTRVLDTLPDWGDCIRALPEDPLSAVVIELRRLGLPEERWAGYLERLALELPGWSGMFLWRHLRPGYAGLQRVPVDMTDYLAVRLVLERLYAQRLCRETWMIEASFDVIRWYFHHNRAEFLVRYMAYNKHLPEYLVTLAQRLLNCSTLCTTDTAQWRHLAHMIWTWYQSPASDRPGGFNVYRSAWRLFRLTQHLGVCGAAIRDLDRTTVQGILDCLEALDPERAGFLWLQAYEHRYRDQLFNAVIDNHGRGRWHTRTSRPDSQIVFCMDDREEGFRRHLEEHNPNIETLGAAGFFGVPINWRGLDDRTATPLCPIVVTPAHEIHEIPRAGQESSAARHATRRRRRLWLKDLIFQETRRSLLRATLLILGAAPVALGVLIAKVLAPRTLGRLSEHLRERFDGDVATRVRITRRDAAPATPERPRPGFTDDEQADRVEGFLRSIGLEDDFAPLVVLMGHGSGSQNNPHLAAYDCGACSGRHGGPNARVFAAMANRPEIRDRLRQRGWEIPVDTWFLGAEHNTCDEDIAWYDLDVLPPALAPAFARLRADLADAARGSAHERARRLASAPADPTPTRALHHIRGRARDFSQPRPELGHATNAAAFIGRRALSQGVFFDRRVFLISYDPTRDPQGAVLEDILLAAAPVGAGINLEYYFSTVNNERYGCGTKVTHNVTGLFGVMEGTASDLRTGLPRQMIEIHEPMRLQVLVEADIAVLAAVYERQPPLQELIGNGWMLLSAKDPHSAAIHVFVPGTGFVRWSGETTPLPVMPRSSDWYRGQTGPLPPARIDRDGSRR